MIKQPFQPLPQPKKVISPRVKALEAQKEQLKKKMGLKGSINEGDLINKSKSQLRRIAIMGLI